MLTLHIRTQVGPEALCQSDKSAFFGAFAPCIASYSLQFSQPYGFFALISDSYIALYSLYSLYSLSCSYARQSPHLLLVPIRGASRMRKDHRGYTSRTSYTPVCKCMFLLHKVRTGELSPRYTEPKLTRTDCVSAIITEICAYFRRPTRTKVQVDRAAPVCHISVPLAEKSERVPRKRPPVRQSVRSVSQHLFVQSDVIPSLNVENDRHQNGVLGEWH